MFQEWDIWGKVSMMTKDMRWRWDDRCKDFKEHNCTRIHHDGTKSPVKHFLGNFRGSKSRQSPPFLSILSLCDVGVRDPDVMTSQYRRYFYTSVTSPLPWRFKLIEIGIRCYHCGWYYFVYMDLTLYRKMTYIEMTRFRVPNVDSWMHVFIP